MIFDKVRAIIAEQLDVNEDKIDENTALIEDLGADSLDMVDLVMSFEDEFDIEITDDQVENVKTVGDIVKFLEESID